MCSAVILRRNIYINLSALDTSLNKINIISLISLLTAIIIKSKVIFVINSFNRDNFIIKSIDIELQGYINIYNGYNRPYNL